MKKMLLSLCLAAILLTFAIAPALATGSEPSNNEWMGQALSSIQQLTAPDCQLTVSGTSAVAVEPDMASIVIGVSFDDPSVIAAQENANKAMASIVDELKALGIEQRQMSTNNYNIGQVYDYNQNPAKFIGYQVSNTLTVEVQEFALISQVIDKSVQAGATQVQNVSFDSSKRAELYREALQNAISIARDKASLMATAAGKQLGALRTLTEIPQNGNVLYNQFDARKSETAAAAPILGGQIDVSAQVTLVYDLK